MNFILHLHLTKIFQFSQLSKWFKKTSHRGKVYFSGFFRNYMGVFWIEVRNCFGNEFFWIHKTEKPKRPYTVSIEEKVVQHNEFYSLNVIISILKSKFVVQIPRSPKIKAKFLFIAASHPTTKKSSVGQERSLIRIGNQ